jgi:ribonuclease P protein component
MKAVGERLLRRAQLGLVTQERLRNSRRFREIIMWGRKIRGPHLTIFYQPNALRHNRLGISVRKKRVKLSTQRHLIKRRLREAYRTNKMLFLPGNDIVISFNGYKNKVMSNSVNFAQLRQELLLLAGKANLLISEAKKS